MAVQASNLPPGCLTRWREFIPHLTRIWYHPGGAGGEDGFSFLDKRKWNRMEITFNYCFIELLLTDCVQKTGVY